MSETTPPSDDSTMPDGGKSELSRQDAIEAMEELLFVVENLAWNVFPLGNVALQSRIEKARGLLAKPESKP